MDFANMKDAELVIAQGQAVDRIKATLATIKDEDRSPTEAEVEQMEADNQLVDDCKAETERRDELKAKARKLGDMVSQQPQRQTVPHEPTNGRVNISTKPKWEDDPMKGYKTHREFLLDVMSAGQGKEPSEQLKFLAAVGSDEQVAGDDPYGGFLLPEGMMPDVKSVPMDVDPTQGVMDIPMQTETVKINARVDKKHTSSVSGGLTVSRTTETGSISSSRMEFEQIKLEATTLTGLAYASEQLLSRSPVSFAALLQRGFNDEFVSKKIDEKISGTGVGEPEGILNCPATIAITRAGGGNSIDAADITAMRKRSWRFGQSIWIANHDTYDDLAAAHIAGTNSDKFLFAPEQGQGSPATLLGRPIFFTEHVPGLGSKGDLILAQWSEYLWGSLTGMNSAESIHVRFVNHERTFKFWEENDGRCWWRAALTPKNGANTLSPFVVIAA